MTKFLTVLAASGAVALGSIAAPTSADARCRGCGIAAGVIGGIAAGAAIAGAGSAPSYYYGPGYAYDPGYAYPPAYAYDGPAYYGEYGYYGYRRWGGTTDDYTNSHRQLQGTR